MPTPVAITPAASPANPGGQDVTWQAADTTNNNETPLTGKEQIFARNTGGSAHSVTITSTNDALGRMGNITESLAAGEMKRYGPFSLDKGWIQTDGKLYFQADDAEVEFAVVRHA